MEKVISVQGLRKSYGAKTAVAGLTFEVEKGETFGLLGPNGAGKSTSIACMLGVKKADGGTVSILGKNPVVERRSLFERVGVQFQQAHHQAKIKVEEICQVTHSLYRHPADWKMLLDTFGLSGMEKRMVAELSGGERQKLFVLLALIPNPEVVFLDELTTGLDVKARREVWRYLERLKQNGLTIFLTSHYMDEVNALCDRICILKNGQVAVLDTVKGVLENSPYQTLEDAYLWYAGEEETDHESLSCPA